MRWCTLTSLTLLSIYTSVESEIITASIGDTKIINCKTTDNIYTYRWAAGDNFSYLWLHQNEKFTGVQSESLTIHNISFSDASIYRCVVHRLAGIFHKEEKFTLEVYGEWLAWTVCGGSCGQGVRSRNRLCQTPPLSNDDNICMKSNIQNESCYVEGCPVNGAWGGWSSTECSVTCGYGKITRTRECNSPEPSNGGNGCLESNIEIIDCGSDNCPVNGGWSGWSSSGCSVTCGIGTTTGTRQCNSPKPSNGGLGCQGSATEQLTCGSENCPVDGQWTSWSEWSLCSTSCGGGNRTRVRNCTNPSPLFGGQICSGGKMENDVCSTHNCPAAMTSDGDSQGAVVGGTVGAVVVVLLIVVIVVIVLRKGRRGSTERDKKAFTSKHFNHAGENVLFRPEPTNQGSVYLNIGRESGLSCTDTDDDVQLASTKVNKESDPDNVYFNVVLDESPVLTNTNVDELGEYIKKRQINDGLHEEYKNLPHGPQYPTAIATTKENMPKNRFKMIYPYDHTRVVLFDGSDYINANYIDGFEKEKCYIACQGPTKTTLVDHWKMIWQLNIRRIVMLTNLVEGAKRKCERYWPEEEVVITFGRFVLTLLSVKTRASYVTREISVEDKTTKEKRTIIQYHFTSWPDHGTPDPLYLVLFHRHVISEQTASNMGPMLVHCSAGIGRTGTYIGLDALYEQGKTTGFIDVVAFVKKMRYCRINMVQTHEQYVCLHRALHEAFTMKDKNINKNDFGMVWKKITTDKRPINHQILREEFKMLEEKKLDHVETDHVFATSPENKDKNRTMSVLPADKDRVYLSSFEKGRTDYINAVRLPSYTKLIGYVSTQLPLPETKVDFWTMIRDQDSSVIVMFLKEHSDADFVYSTAKATGSIGLNTLKISSTADEEHGIKVISLILNKKDTKQKDIIIFQVEYNGFPEAEVLCKLINLISTRIDLTDGPVTVVSCDGASICGLFCTLTNAVSSMTIDENADIFQLARLLQLRRPEFFQEFEEYRKVYDAVNYYLESTNVYANF